MWISIILLFSNAQSVNRGLSWGRDEIVHTNKSNVVRVSCGGVPAIPNQLPWNPQAGHCNPIDGDTPCSFRLPILCIKKAGYNRPCYGIPCEGHAKPRENYHGWSGGIVALSLPTIGNDLLSKSNADSICVKRFGPGWEMASETDGRYVLGMNKRNFCYSTWPSYSLGGEWSFYSYWGRDVMLSRFWVYTANPQGNCF